MCDVDEEAVVAAVDAPSIYDIPKVLHAEGLDAYVVRRLGPAVPRRRLDRRGTSCCAGSTTPTHEVTVALVGKYIDLPDAYLSVTEALRAGGFANDARVKIRWVPSDDCETPEGAARAARRRRRASASPAASASAASRASSARSGTPASTASRCSASASACSAWSSSTPATWPASTDADSHRVRPRRPPHPVIATMAEQLRHRRRRAATWAAPCGSASTRPSSREGSLVREALRRRPTSTSATGTATRSTTPTATELEEAGLVFSGTSPDGHLVEYVELPRDVHPYFVATQAHPELRSRPTRPHPLFAGLVEAALARQA